MKRKMMGRHKGSRSDRKVARPEPGKTYKFENTYCSQCGREFGPGDHGYSHCENHRADNQQ